MKLKTRVIFRADGNSSLGLGHVVRSLALAEILRPEFDVTFAIQEPTAALKELIGTTCPEVISLPLSQSETELLAEAARLAASLTGTDILVLDGYHFSTAYQRVLKQQGHVLVCIDDLHDRLFAADAVINVAGGVAPQAYALAPYTRLYLGPAFSLLRKPFREVQKTPCLEPQKPNRVLVCFGGADPENHTLDYAQKLTGITGIHLEIVTGSAYRHGSSLAEWVGPNKAVTWHQNLSAEAMASLMMDCQAAVCSASSVAYEYCAVNGMLFVLQTAGNQADLYRFLTEESLALPAGEVFSVLTQPNATALAARIQENQRRLFNGQAEANLRQIFNVLQVAAGLKFRQVTPADTTLLFNWANDPVVRQFSFNSAPIPLETHQNWLNRKLQDPAALLLLGEIFEEPAALLRFDRQGNTALISFQIGAAFRGKGLAHRVLQLGLLALKAYFPDVSLAYGFVQPANLASVKAFEKAGFRNEGLDPEQNAYRFSQPLP